MGLFKFAWELVKVFAGLVGILIGGLLGMAVFYVAMYAIGGGFVLLWFLAKEQPLLGVPLLALAVLFCLWCAYFQKGNSTPQHTVLRGPFVVKSDQHPLHIRIRRGSGEVQAEPEDSESPVADATRRP